VHDTCELGFQHISAPASELQGMVLGGCTEDMIEQYLLFRHFAVSIGGDVGRFVPMVTKAARGDTGLFNI
jgi:hypothetical protein